MPGSVGTQAAQKAAAQKKAAEKKKGKASTTAEDTAGNPPASTATSKTALSGVPVGTQILTGMEYNAMYSGGTPKKGLGPVFSKAQYTAQSVYDIPSQMDNQQKADLLLRLASIPGLYAKGEAPTVDYIRKMAKSKVITFRPEDSAAFQKVLTAADAAGQKYNDALSRFISDPGLAEQYFGKVTTAAKTVATSSPDALISELNARFLDVFDMPADKKTADAYAKEVIALQKKAGLAGQNITQQQVEDIYQKYVAQTANTRFAKVKGTTDTADDALIEKGSLGATVRTIRNAYADNGIPVKEAEVYKIALGATRSQQALQNALDDINMQAAIQFPALKDWFAKGKTAKTFFAPYTTAYSQIYGVPEEQVDVTKFYDVASGTSVVPVNQWIKNQWSNPAIKQTDYYKEINRNDLRAVAEAFGMTV